MPLALPDHALRAELTNEVHARPFAPVSAPARASHLALFRGEGGRAEDHAHLAALCRRHGLAPPPEDSAHHIADLGELRLKWERHAEFTSYTFFRDGASPEGLFGDPAIALAPEDWVAAIPGEVVVAVHAEIEPPGVPARDPSAMAALFGSESFAGSLVTGGAAAAWMDFSMVCDGFGRLLIQDRGLRPRQAGRLLQRLFEIETYRMMALLGLPLARDAGPMLTEANRSMLSITERMAEIGGVDDETALLEELTGVSRRIESVAARSGFRFGASRAYYALVRRRIEELREERIEGLQTFVEFMERRLAPAMRTCETIAERIDRLSRRLNRAGQLLRTRVDIQLEAQNRDLLRSMDRRAKLQLRLQETVEGLSVAAITYYLVGLIAYALKALSKSGLAIPVEALTGLSIPFVAALVWYGVRRARRLVAHLSERVDA